MALTTGSNIFFCSREDAIFAAECGGLRHEITSEPQEKEGGLPQWYGSATGYDMWQDRATAGGGCRIVFYPLAGIAWVSRHSGYPQADITEDIANVFRERGCREAGDVEGVSFIPLNPHTHPPGIDWDCYSPPWGDGAEVDVEKDERVRARFDVAHG